MRQIWKFPVQPGEFTLEMPVAIEYLGVQMQNGNPYMWVIVDTACSVSKYKFVTYGTGHDIPNNVDLEEYIGTFQMLKSALVWHLFALESATNSYCRL